MKLHRHCLVRFLPRAAAVAAGIACACGSLAQEVPPVPAPASPPAAGATPPAPGKSEIEKPAREVERRERELTVDAAMKRLKDLQTEVDQLRAKAAALTENLASSKTEADEAKDNYGRMRLQMEALGLAALSGDERSLQLRLLNAVNDFRLSEKQKQLLAEQLAKISEAAIAFMNAGDEENRRRLAEAVKESNSILHNAADQEKTEPVPLESAKVVSFKKDLGLAVINAGKDSGLRLGMPLKFYRQDKSVAQGVVVDCRERITGVLITTHAADKESVAVGDAIKLEATPDLKKK